MNRSTEYERRQAAREFAIRNPDVWILFQRFTWEKINAGFQHYSVRIVKFKLGDHHAKFYGQAFMKHNPQFEGFFRKREVKEI